MKSNNVKKMVKIAPQVLIFGAEWLRGEYIRQGLITPTSIKKRRAA